MAEISSIVICVNRRFSAQKPSCAARGAEEVAEELELALERHDLPFEVQRVYCLGLCERGPNLRLAPGGRFYTGFALDDIDNLIEELTN